MDIGLVSELMKQGVKLLVIDTQCSNVHYSDEIFSRDKRLNYENINEENVKLKADWELVMSYNPKLIYYAHANEKGL